MEATPCSPSDPFPPLVLGWQHSFPGLEPRPTEVHTSTLGSFTVRLKSHPLSSLQGFVHVYPACSGLSPQVGLNLAEP